MVEIEPTIPVTNAKAARRPWPFWRVQGMQRIVADVEEFMRAGDQTVRTRPAIPTPEEKELRQTLIDEEVNRELLPALADDDMERIADGLADSIVVIVGTAISYGIPLDRVWAAVMDANMRKVDPTTGKLRKRADGKVLKPDGWTPPDIAAELEPLPIKQTGDRR